MMNNEFCFSLPFGLCYCCILSLEMVEFSCITSLWDRDTYKGKKAQTRHQRIKNKGSLQNFESRVTCYVSIKFTGVEDAFSCDYKQNTQRVYYKNRSEGKDGKEGKESNVSHSFVENMFY